MKHFNVPAIDGIPGIMPGTVKVPPPPEFAEEEIESAQPQDRKNHHPGIGTRFPNTNVAGCHATKKTRTSPYYLLQSGIFVYEGSAFFILFLSFCGSLTNGEYRKKINKHWILRYAQNDNIKKLSFKRAFYKKYYT